MENLSSPNDAHRSRKTGASSAGVTSAGVSSARLLPNAQRSAARGPSRLRRGTGFMLAAVGSLAVLLATGAASASRTPSSKHGRAVQASHKQAHASQSRSAGRVEARHARPRPAAAPAMVSKATPRVNAVWDNPVLSPAVLEAILDAAGDCEIAPDLLVSLAWRESRFAPKARSTLSSAAGLLQFTSKTWLQAVHQFGSQHGIGDYAAAIHRDRSGEYTGQGSQAAILALRNDPVLSASMAGEVLKQHRTAMQASIGRSMTPADLYLAYVMGSTSAARFLIALRQRPSASARGVISRRVLRNAGLLARDGRPLTVRGTYDGVRMMLADDHAHFEPSIAVAIEKRLPDE